MSALKKVTMKAGSAPKKNPFSALRETQIITSKPVFPAEIISQILDYCTVPCLLRVARVSKRMREMAYDDTRWVQRLTLMGCWSEAEARQRAEEARRRITQSHQAPKKTGSGTNGIAVSGREAPTETLFDATGEEKRWSREFDGGAGHKVTDNLNDGFDAIDLAPHRQGEDADIRWTHDTASKLDVFTRVRSIRDHARQEYGRVHGALASLYNDAVRCQNHRQAVVFRTYRDPNQQAVMLSNLIRFCDGDIAVGWRQRKEKLEALVAAFESAVSKEFEQAVEDHDVGGKMSKYAHVLVSLNGGGKVVEMLIEESDVLSGRANLGDPMDCLRDIAPGAFAADPSNSFFSDLSTAINEQVSIFDQVFPPTVHAVIPYLQRVGKQVIVSYLGSLFDEAHRVNVETYLKAVSATCSQALTFAKSLRPASGSEDEFYEAVDTIIAEAFEPHIDLYLQEELAFFQGKSDAEVSEWERQLSEQDASMTSMFMSNVNRQANKRDFLTSFKKVVMMPVNVVSSPFGSSKPATAKALVNGDSLTAQNPTSGSSSPSISHTNGNPLTVHVPRTPLSDPPTTELAAQAAIMNSRLEGIRSLFSIEVALTLVHRAKSSIERAAVFLSLGGAFASAARRQCEQIFTHLLQSLGTRHVQAGFDTAISHLSAYNPRDATGSQSRASTSTSAAEVAPLVTFLELVNVGDLIQQMLDVFYEQELVAPGLTHKDDFLNPAVKAKKKFEQMLDSRVAAGLNKGIEVLMDEVEYVLATTQQPQDYHPEVAPTPVPVTPPPSSSTTTNPNTSSKDTLPDTATDIGPSPTCRHVIALVEKHTALLVGSTDPQILDVFHQEIGLRLFTLLCKHLKRHRISVRGAVTLISDTTAYHASVRASLLRGGGHRGSSTSGGGARGGAGDLLAYFVALRHLAQIYLVDGGDAKALAGVMADPGRYEGVWRVEEVVEFAERRADWYAIRGQVERAMVGGGCVVM